MKARKEKKDVKFAGEAAITKAEDQHIIEGKSHDEAVGGYRDGYFGTRQGCLLGVVKAIVEAENGLVVEGGSETVGASLFCLFGKKKDHGYGNELLPIRYPFLLFHLVEDAEDGR